MAKNIDFVKVNNLLDKMEQCLHKVKSLNEGLKSIESGQKKAA